MNTFDIQKRIKRFTLRNLNLFLLIGIFGLFFINPALELKTGKEFPETIFFTIIFLAAVVAVKAGNNRLLIAALFFSAYIWFDLLFLGEKTRYRLTFFLLIIYFAYIVIRLISKVIKTKDVTSDVIMEAINIYLLIGIVGALIFGVINYFIPGSIPAISSDTRQFNDYLYFSFVTLTTLGYGDISPVKHLAQSFAVTLAITGQFYITIVMAFLVSKFITSNTKEN